MQKCKNAKMIILSVLVAAGISACGNDKTELSWTNRSDDSVRDIVWSPNSGNNSSWNETLSANGETTSSKEVADESSDDLIGQGFAAIGDGAPAEILIDGSPSIRLSSGAANNYDITTTAKKK